MVAPDPAAAGAGVAGAPCHPLLIVVVGAVVLRKLTAPGSWGEPGNIRLVLQGLLFPSLQLRFGKWQAELSRNFEANKVPKRSSNTLGKLGEALKGGSLIRRPIVDLQPR